MTARGSEATITSLAGAARAAGVTPATIRDWIKKGLLEKGPWTEQKIVDAAAKLGPGKRGTAAPHGSADRHRVGCRCDDCRRAHNADLATRRREAREREWATLGPQLIAAIAEGTSYGEATERVGVTASAITAHRRRDPAFAAELDAALMFGRDDSLAHGQHSAWRAGCRCPECRDTHERSRS